MRTLSRTLALAICATAIALTSVTPALASYGNKTLRNASMSIGAAAVAPAGYVGFCLRHLTECTRPSNGPATVQMTMQRWHEINDIQAQVNHALRPSTEGPHIWDYPTDGTADCNKYALAKQKALIYAGWPPEALLLTVARTEDGEGHLVLVATTSAGDLVLDNRMAHVVDWRQLPYSWIARQSQAQPTQWVSLG